MESFKEKEKSEVQKSKTSLKRDQSGNESQNLNSGTFITNGAGLVPGAVEDSKQQELQEEQKSQVKDPVPEQEMEVGSEQATKREHALSSFQHPQVEENKSEKPVDGEKA